jgi:hypothetical protein
MSTITKKSTTKSTKSTKKTSKLEDTELENPELETTETTEMKETSVHSVYNGEYKRDPVKARHFLEFYNVFKAQFLTGDDGVCDDSSASDILKYYWGEDLEQLKQLITKSNQREKKKAVKFSVEGLKKPLTANHLFGQDYKTKCDAKGTKYSLKDSSAAWQALTDKEKDKYRNQADALKLEYKAKFDKLRSNAINDGDFPEDKPKKPLSSYFRFLEEKREELGEKYKNNSTIKNISTQVSKDAGILWKELSEDEKLSYKIPDEEKEEYAVKLEEWNVRKEERQNKKNGNPLEIKIESTGKKEVVIKDATDDEAATDNEIVPEPVVVKKSASKPKKTKTESVESVEEDNVVVEDIKSKPKKSTKVSKA